MQGVKHGRSEMDVTRLGKWERKMLRRIHRARNMESENLSGMRELYKNLAILTDS